jgi:integrase
VRVLGSALSAPCVIIEIEVELGQETAQGLSIQDRNHPATVTSRRRPRTFNKDRSAALSLLSTLVGEHHWLYTQATRVDPLKVPEEAINPQTVDQVRALAAKLAPHHARTLWAMALTGMRPEEFFEEAGNRWTLEANGVRIEGTKTKASRRSVPRVGMIVKPATKRLAFTGRSARRAERW